MLDKNLTPTRGWIPSLNRVHKTMLTSAPHKRGDNPAPARPLVASRLHSYMRESPVNGGSQHDNRIFQPCIRGDVPMFMPVWAFYELWPAINCPLTAKDSRHKLHRPSRCYTLLE